MGVEAAIRAAVESQGYPWQARARVAGPAALADALTAVLAGLDIGHKKDFLASLIGECAQESDWYCAKTEYGGSNKSYAPYYGRGFIQLTHVYNYRPFTGYARQRYPGAPDFVSDPDAVTRDLKWCWLTGVWYYIRNIREEYWARHDWDSISGIINAGYPSYRGPSWAARATACNAAYNALGDDWEDDMPSADEVAKAVWAHQIEMQGRSPNSGKTVSAGTVLGWIDDQFSGMPDKVMGRTVKRQGLPESDPRAGKEVTVEQIFAWLDAQFTAINDRLDRLEAAPLPSSPETAPEAPQRAAVQSETGVMASEAGADGAGADFYGEAPNIGINEVEGMPGYYKVRKGDTARWIAKKAGLRYSELVKMNPELQASFGMVSNGQLLKVREV